MSFYKKYQGTLFACREILYKKVLYNFYLKCTVKEKNILWSGLKKDGLQAKKSFWENSV